MSRWSVLPPPPTHTWVFLLFPKVHGVTNDYRKRPKSVTFGCSVTKAQRGLQLEFCETRYARRR